VLPIIGPLPVEHVRVDEPLAPAVDLEVAVGHYVVGPIRRPISGPVALGLDQPDERVEQVAVHFAPALDHVLVRSGVLPVSPTSTILTARHGTEAMNSSASRMVICALAVGVILTVRTRRLAEPVERGLERLERLRIGRKDAKREPRPARDRVFRDRDTGNLIQPADEFAAQPYVVERRSEHHGSKLDLGPPVGPDADGPVIPASMVENRDEQAFDRAGAPGEAREVNPRPFDELTPDLCVGRTALCLKLIEKRSLIPLALLARSLAHLRGRGLADSSRHERAQAVGPDVLLDLDRDHLGHHLLVQELDNAEKLARDLVRDEDQPDSPRLQVDSRLIPVSLGVRIADAMRLALRCPPPAPRRSPPRLKSDSRSVRGAV
jgi:hypothetical protein